MTTHTIECVAYPEFLKLIFKYFIFKFDNIRELSKIYFVFLEASALATLVKEIKSTEVVGSNSHFTKELIELQDDEPGQVLYNALMATINNTFKYKYLEEAVALLSAVPCGDSHADAI